jgi:EpsI family protein
MLILGIVSSTSVLQELSMLIVLPGVVLMTLGKSFLKRLAFPIVYLIFMISVMDIFLDRLHWPSQLFSATMASKVLNLFNIPVFHYDNYLELPNVTLEVANSCSGVRHLVSIVALGIPLAYFTQNGVWRKIILITFGVIVGILTNGFRIVLIGIFAYNGGEVLHGPFHVFQGLFVAVIGFVILFAGAVVLKKISPGNAAESSITVNDSHDKVPHNFKLFNFALIIGAVLLVATGCYSYLYDPVPVKIKNASKKLPDQVGDWKAEYTANRNKFFKAQGADSEVEGFYHNASGRTIRVYIGYFEKQNQDKEIVSYKNDSLYNNSREISIPVPYGKNVKINKTVLKEGNDKYLSLFWHDLDGKIVANKYKAKLVSALDGLFHRRTNGAIVVVSSSILAPQEAENVLADEIGFIQVFLPVLKDYL